MSFAQRFHLLKLVAVTGTIAVSVSVAHATPIVYDLTGVTTSAGSLTGTVTIDSVTDRVTLADITFNDAAAGDPVFDNIGSPNAYNDLGQDYISGPSDSPLNYGGQIALYYDAANIGTANSLAICIVGGPCGTEFSQASYTQVYVSNGEGGPFYITRGSLDPSFPEPPAVPEPTPLLLLGTGMLALAAAAARFGRSRA